ncbi:MAG: TlyA family RNA methyltransferase [Clostridia bacterium]|nr:TlyA family RNA methyltransferase [Clostridia bacterium]
MKRADILLAEKGLAKSRSAAAAFIKEGRVSANGKKVAKPGELLEENCEINVEYPQTLYVSRGGIKLEHALSVFGVEAKGKICLDIGASTGGFTHCLLTHGAKKVYAVDSDTAQLDPTLRADSRVVSRENVNARYLTETDFEDKIDLIVMDVSFISQTLLYPACAAVLCAGGVMVTLVKPQFETGSRARHKNGVIKDKDGKNAAALIKKLAASASEYGFRLTDTAVSPITGGDGNVEYLAAFVKE